MEVSTRLLAEKTVFVTGAGANIGRAIALEMAAQGADVYFADYQPERCARLEEEISALGRKTRGFVADLSNEQQITAFYEQLTSDGIEIDILVNNVGVRRENSTDVTQWWERWRQVYDTNIIGPCYLTRLVVDSMLQSGTPGNVIFITSIHQQMTRGNAAYSSSKAALGMIVQELALELAPHNIRVNGIAPGYVVEDGAGKALSHPPTPLKATSIPPAYVGRAAVYLSAEYFSKHTTGSILTLDGGLSLVNHLTPSTPPQTSQLQKIAHKLRRTTRQ